MSPPPPSTVRNPLRGTCRVRAREALVDWATVGDGSHTRDDVIHRFKGPISASSFSQLAGIGGKEPSIESSGFFGSKSSPGTP